MSEGFEIEIPNELYQVIEAYARDREISVEEAVHRLIRQYIAKCMELRAQ